jgi:hypothetical protein
MLFSWDYNEKQKNIRIMFNILEFTQNNLIAFEVTGKIEKKDYEKLKAILEKTEREYVDLRLFIELSDLKGMTLPALMEDIKTYFKHIRKVKKVAIVGRNGVDQELTRITDFFISANARYFTKKEYEKAKNWIRE